ncbi:VOC family protein [Actibacterium ureilyticum]|uniref:VOC family protein n=1 Tax=Actibacterium ureilyticum TaxID=1590614 RepID=UPI000BAB0346|nr:VOC family protein [Actibacterium ureilyticum]
MLQFDHIAICADALETGADRVQAALGVPLAPGGAHPLMGTHNRLLSLGPDEYLEVITPDPAAPPPGRARWFGLDHPPATPRLGNWIARCTDMEAEIARSPAGAGRALDLSRGDLHWRMAVPDDGQLPYDNVFPALIAWPPGAAHPASRLPDHGLRLTELTLCHTDIDGLRAALMGRIDDPRLRFAQTQAPAIRATIATPSGPVVLS